MQADTTHADYTGPVVDVEGRASSHELDEDEHDSSHFRTSDEGDKCHFIEMPSVKIVLQKKLWVLGSTFKYRLAPSLDSQPSLKAKIESVLEMAFNIWFNPVGLLNIVKGDTSNSNLRIGYSNKHVAHLAHADIPVSNKELKITFFPRSLKLSEVQIKDLLMHEFGHIFGFEHYEKRSDPNVIDYGPSTIPTIMREDFDDMEFAPTDHIAASIIYSNGFPRESEVQRIIPK